MKFFLLIFLLISFLMNVHSQDITKSLEEVYVNSVRDSLLFSANNQRMNRGELKNISSDDIGSLTQKFSGVSMKNYGGIGGLKTISFRGITGNHTSIIMDGFAVQNNQVGQIDLGTIQSENVELVTLSSSSSTSMLSPVSSILQGNSLAIITFENSFLTADRQVRWTEKKGSFGQSDSYLAYKKRINRGYVSAFVKYKYFRGDYKYEFKNVLFDYEGYRLNNDLNEGAVGISFGKIIGKRYKIRTNYLYYGSDKGLPGAVVLYNESANQRLNTQNHQYNGEIIYCGAKTSGRFYTTLQSGLLRYLDPSYLNNQGGLFQQYLNKLFQLGYSMNHRMKDSTMNFFSGIELTNSHLLEIGTILKPYRNHLQTITGISLMKQTFRLSMIVGNHQVFNYFASKWNYKNAFVGDFEWICMKQNRWLSLPRIQLKRTFRMPSFGELYYNQIGNVTLFPEIVNQGNTGLSYFFFKNTLQVSFDAYTNLVENKILAIPTKNLFVWSMQNVGKVVINGLDVLVKKSLKINSLSLFCVRMNYSLQRALDYSDKSSITYKSQIAYIPVHSANVDLNYSYNQNWGISLNNIVTSERYALNENIDANRLKGFLITDLNMFYLFNFKKSNQFRISFSVKNLLNKSYAYVRYYVMPGVNYLFTLNYEFN